MDLEQSQIDEIRLAVEKRTMTKTKIMLKYKISYYRLQQLLGRGYQRIPAHLKGKRGRRWAEKKEKKVNRWPDTSIISDE